MTKIWCESCEEFQKLQVEEMKETKQTIFEKAWGDLMCEKCNFVIATLTVDEPGSYEFRIVGIKKF